MKKKPSSKIDNSRSEDKQTQINLQPTIDSYIINTIKLNRIINSGLAFDKIEYFTNKKTRQPEKRSKIKSRNIVINSDKEARICLRQFITIMSIHCGFTGIISNFNEIDNINEDIL